MFALLLLAALSLRLGWVLTRPADVRSFEQLPDQREYYQIAQNLLGGEGLAFSDTRFNDRVYAYRTPGYPVLVAACGGSIRAVRIVQSLLDISSVLAVYLLARQWFTSGRAILAGCLVAFNPFLVYFCGLILSETLFTVMLAWGMFCVASRRTRMWLLGGALLALSSLVRPGAIGFAVLLGVLAAMMNRSGEHPYQRKWPIPVGATMLLLTLAAVFPWAYRNHRVVGEWVWTSTNAGITSYDGLNPDATGASDQRFVAHMPELKKMNETARNQYLADEAEAWAKNNPARALRLALVKVGRTWAPRPLSGEFSRPAYVAMALAFSLPFDVLLIAGLMSRRLPTSAKILLIAPAAYLTLAAAVTVGSLRYRIPAEVPLAIVAAAGLPASIRFGRAEDPTA